MQTVEHAIATMQPRGTTSQRVTGFVLAGALQAALIAALIVGLDIKILPEPDRHTEYKVIPTKTVERTTPVIPPLGYPTGATAPIPTIPIEGGTGPTTITTVIGPMVPRYDRMAMGIDGTHTTPPYPPLALRLGEEGSVRLHLTISPQGTVTEAQVVGTSGYDDLDRAARNWVLAHWRYRPALRGGAAVVSESTVLVRFDLKNAH